MSDVEGFSLAVMRAIAEAANQYHPDNVDTLRFASLRTGRTRVTAAVKRVLTRVLSFRGYHLTRSPRAGQGANTSLLEGQLEAFADLYARLADDASRQLLVQIVVFRMLGSDYVVLPWGREQRYLREAQALSRLVDSDEVVPIAFMGWHLMRYDLRPIGCDLRLFLMPSTVMNTFRIRQYEYRAPDVHVAAPRGRAVIDCGGGWGDTALYFAEVMQAPVFTFEFVPSNLDILRRNLALNPRQAALVRVIERAVWSASDQRLWVSDNGPGSRVSDQPSPGSQQVRTQSIDDLVARERITDVGFIKMDIEGAERDALDGCRNTIERDQPILAISVYHRRDDLAAIPRRIMQLGVPYRLYLGHYTMHAEETVLFAVPRAGASPS